VKGSQEAGSGGFVGAPGGTERGEARAMSRGKTFPGPRNSGCRQLTIFKLRQAEPNSVKPEARAKGKWLLDKKRGFPQLAFFDGTPGKTKIREARGASRGNAVRGSNNVISLSLRFGLRSMCFLTDFFADRRERATSKLGFRASKHRAPQPLADQPLHFSNGLGHADKDGPSDD
jgi:hypothetical protein